MRRLLPLVVVAVVAAGCGTAKTVTVTTSVTSTVTPTQTRTSAQKTVVRVYFLRDGKVAPVAREVGPTPAVAGAALGQLLKGPLGKESSLGLTSEVPTTTFAPAVHGGVLDLGTVSAALSHGALAQLVYTLTQFATVISV